MSVGNKRYKLFDIQYNDCPMCVKLMNTRSAPPLAVKTIIDFVTFNVEA